MRTVRLTHHLVPFFPVRHLLPAFSLVLLSLWLDSVVACISWCQFILLTFWCLLVFSSMLDWSCLEPFLCSSVVGSGFCGAAATGSASISWMWAKQHNGVRLLSYAWMSSNFQKCVVCSAVFLYNNTQRVENTLALVKTNICIQSKIQ